MGYVIGVVDRGVVVGGVVVGGGVVIDVVGGVGRGDDVVVTGGVAVVGVF